MLRLADLPQLSPDYKKGDMTEWPTARLYRNLQEDAFIWREESFLVVMRAYNLTLALQRTEGRMIFYLMAPLRQQYLDFFYWS